MAFYGRGGGFSARGGRGRSTYTFSKRTEWKPDLVKYPLGELLATFNTSSLEPSSTDHTHSATIEDCQYVASYNWTENKSPAILVPGKPPLWTPLKQPQRLNEDSGTYFRDPNAARFPSYPTEPAVRALFSTKPDFATDGVDIFACGSTMGNLLRFVRRLDKPFRFSLQVIGETVFLVRKENDPKEIIEGVRGYGHTFPEAYTTWEPEVKGSESHQRLVQYTFGGFKCMLRFESDGYLNSTQQPDTAKMKSAQTPTMNDLLSALNDTTITKPPPTAENTLTVHTAGSHVPQTALFDLKTRSHRAGRDIDMSDIYPLLWLKQIPNFIVAYHDGRGTFHDIRVQSVQPDVQDWEQANKSAIQRLAVLLRKLVDLARTDAVGLLEVYMPSVDRLEIRRQVGGGVHALPAELRAKWEAAVGRESDKDSDDGVLLDKGIVGVDEVSDDDEVYERDENGVHGLWIGDDSDDEEPDYTACSAHDCGYCGKCTY